MAGSYGNYYKVSRGPLKGKTIYISKAQRGALSRDDLLAQLNDGAQQWVDAADTEKPAGQAKTKDGTAQVRAARIREVSQRITDAQQIADTYERQTSIRAAEQELRDLYAEMTQDLPIDPDTDEALGSYQGGGYDSINKILWGGTVDPVNGSLSFTDDGNTFPYNIYASHIMRLMDLVPKVSAQSAMITYRSANADHPLTKWAATVQVGDTYLNKGFDSSSFSPDFDPVKGGGAAATRLIFNIPEGSHGIYFNGLSGYSERTGGLSSELEWLLPANGVWSVGRVEDVKGVRMVYVDLIGQRDLNGNSIWP